MHPNWTTRGRPQAWRQGGRVRTYVPQASAMVPPPWAAAIGALYETAGHRVGVDPEPNARGEVKLTVYGLPQAALGAHLNDPLGKPGEQDPRNIQTTIKRYRPRTAEQRLDAAVGAEEARRLRPGDGAPRSRRGPRRSSEQRKAAWQQTLAELDALQREDPGADPAVIAAWVTAQEALIAARRRGVDTG